MDLSTQSDNQVWLRVTAWMSTLSPSTQTTYSGVIREFCDFLQVEAGSSAAAVAFLSINPTHSMAFREYLLQRPGQAPRAMKREQSEDRRVVLDGMTMRQPADGMQTTAGNATVAKKLSCLRRMFRQLLPLRIDKVNPFDSTECNPPSASSGRKRPTEMIRFSDAERLLELTIGQTHNRGIRDHAVVCLLLGGGMRRGEVIKITLADVRNTELGTMYIRLRATKSGKDFDQAIPQWAANAVHNLFIQRLDQGARPGDPLVNSYTGHGGTYPTHNQMSPAGVYLLFRGYCEQLGIKDCSPHSARATAITKLLEDGKTHSEVMEFSRHSSVQMVEAYNKRRYSVDQSPANDLSYKTTYPVE